MNITLSTGTYFVEDLIDLKIFLGTIELVGLLGPKVLDAWRVTR